MTDRLTDDQLALVLAHPATWAEPSAELENAVVHAVMQAQSPGPALLHAVENPPLVPARRRARKRGRTLVLSAAAVAVFAAGALGVGIRVTGHEDKPEFVSTLASTALEPDAHGSVEMYKSDAGFQVVLDAGGLPPLPADEYYQAWLRNAQGATVALGTFSSSDGEVTLWSGVSATEFATFTVTVEETDRAPAPSGRRVLAGTMRHS